MVLVLFICNFVDISYGEEETSWLTRIINFMFSAKPRPLQGLETNNRCKLVNHIWILVRFQVKGTDIPRIPTFRIILEF